MSDPTTADRNGDVPDDAADPAQIAAALASSAPEGAKADAATAARHPRRLRVRQGEHRQVAARMSRSRVSRATKELSR